MEVERTITQIAELFERNNSTISRELGRNTGDLFVAPNKHMCWRWLVSQGVEMRARKLRYFRRSDFQYAGCLLALASGGYVYLLALVPW